MDNYRLPMHLARNHAYVAYISPFLLVIPNHEEPIRLSIDEVNSYTYDHKKLGQVVGTLPFPVHSGLNALVCYDGAIAIPKLGPNHLREGAVNTLNEILCRLLLGGVACEALDQRDIVWGQLHTNNRIQCVERGYSVASELHARLRNQDVTNTDTMHLLNPPYIRYSELVDAYLVGVSILKSVENLTPSYLIRGLTEIMYRNWSLALANLWITVEQLVDNLWTNRFLGMHDFHPTTPISGRTKTLREDTRTWSVSVRLEILYQAKLVDVATFEKLYSARQARNRLVHSGKQVDMSVVIGVYDATISLLTQCSGLASLPIERLKLLELNTVGLLGTSEEHRAFPDDTYEEWLILSKK